MSTRQQMWTIGIFVAGWIVGIATAAVSIKTDEKGNWFSLVEVTQGTELCVKLRPLGRGEKVVVLPIEDANDIRLMYPKYRVVAQFTGDFMPRVVELPTTLMFSENEDIVGRYDDIIVVYWKGSK